MPDSRIDELDAASEVRESDLFVLQQNGEAKKLTGFTLIRDLATALDAHGGITDISEGQTVGDKTYFTIQYADGTTDTDTLYSKRGDRGEHGTPFYYLKIDIADDSAYHYTSIGNLIPDYIDFPPVEDSCGVSRNGYIFRIDSITSTQIRYVKLASIRGFGVPDGGTTGQYLRKKSNATGDTEWGDSSSGVDSVNGYTGEVTLDADAVGARDASVPIDTSDLASGAIAELHLISFSATDTWQDVAGTTMKAITKSASWVTEDDTVIFDCVPGGTSWADYPPIVDEWSKIRWIMIGNGTIGFYAESAFEINMQVKCLKIKKVG